MAANIVLPLWGNGMTTYSTSWSIQATQVDIGVEAISSVPQAKITDGGAIFVELFANPDNYITLRLARRVDGTRIYVKRVVG